MRQDISYDPARKLFESFMDFSGGLNTEASNERLNDEEFPVLENVDISGRGSAKRRSGRRRINTIEGNGQGMFHYYRMDQDKPDLVLAVSGKLYVMPNDSTDTIEIVTLDGTNPFTFQSELPIEAVQYKADLFIATGTKLVELTFDTTAAWKQDTDYKIGDRVKSGKRIYECKVAGKSGFEPPSHTAGDATDNTVTWTYKFFEWHASTVQPYKPTVLEAIYIGTNGLAADPDSYILDGESASLEVAGIKPSKPTGVVNEKLKLTAYINKPATVTSVDYKWEYKKSGETAWVLGSDWKTGDAGKIWDSFLPTAAQNYDIQVTVRNTAAQTTTALYVLTNYQVNQTENKTMNHVLPIKGLQTCRKIILHWDRILLAYDNVNPYQLYISDLNNPRYIPSTNTINFDAGKQEPITSIVRHRNMLVIFTRSTIQTLTGKTTDNYERNLIHDGIGCLAPNSAKVIGNNIMFLSDEGVQLLKPNQFILEVMNVSRGDSQIKNDIIPSPDACAMVYDSQYWICFPKKKTIYRCYFEAKNVWAKDVSSKLNITQFLQYGDDVYNLTTDGHLYMHDKTVYDDDGEVYNMAVEGKFLDLSASINFKKLKRLYLLAKHYNTELYVTVKADSAFALTPDSGKAVVNKETDFVEWVSTTDPNFSFYEGTKFGSWIMGKSPFGEVALSVQRASIRGKCRRVKVRIENRQSQPCEIYGFGLEFKLKKP